MFFERQMIGYLTRNKDDYIGALRQLPESLSKMFVHAYQSAMFNQMIDMRINEGISLHLPLIGDNVIPIDIYGGPDQRRIIEVTKYNQKKLEKRCKEGKAWVVGLLPGIKSEYSKGFQGELERIIMKKENVNFNDFKIEEANELTSLGMYRPLLQKINNLKWEMNENNCPVFDFWLHKGTYATSLLREIMKSGDMKVY
jgi:tRNA pseudouridine13 synthase